MISHWLEWVELQAFASFASFVCSPVRWWPDTVHAHYIVQWRTCKRQHHQHQRDSHVFCGVYININTYCRAIRTPSLQIANERWQSVRISQQIVHYTYAARLFMHFYLQICMILFFFGVVVELLVGNTHSLESTNWWMHYSLWMRARMLNRKSIPFARGVRLNSSSTYKFLLKECYPLPRTQSFMNRAWWACEVARTPNTHIRQINTYYLRQCTMNTHIAHPHGQGERLDTIKNK